jgi:hypothetical protein
MPTPRGESGVMEGRRGEGKEPERGARGEGLVRERGAREPKEEEEGPPPPAWKGGNSLERLPEEEAPASP